MSFITEIISNLKQCCCPSLGRRQNLTSSFNNLSEPFIQMKNINGNEKFKLDLDQRKRKKTMSCNEIISLNFLDNIQHQAQQKQQNNKAMISSVEVRKTYKKQSNDQQHKSIQQQPTSNLIRRVQSGVIRSSQHLSSSQQSFQTIKSSVSRPLSRRNFKLLRKSSNFFAKHRSQQQQFYSVNQSENSSMDENHVHRIMFNKWEDVGGQRNTDGIDLMNVWLKKEYEGLTGYKPILSQIIKMRLQNKDQFDNIVHKLEDYYTFYYESQPLEQAIQLISGPSKILTSSSNMLGGSFPGSSKLHPSQSKFQPSQSLSHFYESACHNIICSITLTDYTKSFDYEKTCRYMQLIILPHCSVSPLKFLQWFNQLEIQSSLHSFNKIWYLQNSERINENITLEYPLVKVQQFNQKLMGKQQYLMVRQIQVVKFQQQDKETLLQICYQALQQDKCFQRLVRITADGQDMCRVQIYIESSQFINKKCQQNMAGSKNIQKPFGNQDKKLSPQFQYFEQRWKCFEQKLNKDHIINKKIIQVANY